MEAMRTFVCRRPVWIVTIWLAVAMVVGCLSPDLTKLAAEGQAKMVGSDAESRRAAELVKQAWPDEAYEAMAVAVLYRPGGLSEADRGYALRLSQRLEDKKRPDRDCSRSRSDFRSPKSPAAMVSHDGTMTLVAISLSTSFVAPVTEDVVAWMTREASNAELALPKGLDLRWTGDAVIGRDYMANVQTSLDRAAIATVILLLIVLLTVYRSFWLALVPLVTIGISLLISRGILAWMILAGWEVSSLVELFLIALLFGTGTDFCLFISWRYAEHLNPSNPEGSMRVTLAAVVFGAGDECGHDHHRIFLLIGDDPLQALFEHGAERCPGAGDRSGSHPEPDAGTARDFGSNSARGRFEGLAGSSREVWERLGRAAMARPLRSWAFTILAMLPLSILGMNTHFIQDLMVELPANAPSAQDFRLVSSKFEPGMMAPLTVVLESTTDFRSSEGLALIDDVSRLLSHQRQLTEVRSATQPLGSTEPLERARLTSRLGEVNAGFHQLAEGAIKLQKGLTEGAARLRAAIWLESKTGLSLTGKPGDHILPKTDDSVARTSTGGALATGIRQASAVWQWTNGLPSPWTLPVLNNAFAGFGEDAGMPTVRPPLAKSNTGHPPETAKQSPERPQEVLLRELTRAAEGAGQIADGAGRAHREVTSILNDPVGRRALDHLLVNEETVHDHPELKRSFAAYITPDGHRARIDLTQANRMFSHDAMDQVLTLRRRLNEFLGEYQGVKVTAKIAGANAESADVRALTHNDQVQSWFIVPIGVFIVLIIALRDPLACVNLVATMVLTYAFALGATHLLFVNLLGAEGLDWKVPYFLFVLLIAVGVDYNVFLMARLHEESQKRGLRDGIIRAIGQTGGLISSAAMITASSFASFLFSPLGSLRQLGFALVVGILIDAVLVRPLLVPCGHWLLKRTREALSPHIVVRRGKREYAFIPD